MVRPERRRALREALEDLKRYRSTYPRADFLSSRDAQRLILQALYTAIQACVDEALEHCRLHRLDTDGTYRDAFLALGRANLLDASLAARMADWGSMRNVLAHFYAVIDYERLHASLDELGDFDRFLAWLESPRAP